MVGLPGHLGRSPDPGDTSPAQPEAPRPFKLRIGVLQRASQRQLGQADSTDMIGCCRDKDLLHARLSCKALLEIFN